MSSLEAKNTKLQNFYKRTLTTFIIFPPAIYAVYDGGFFYFMLLFIAILIGGYEWDNICGKWSFGTDSMSLITGIMLSMTAFFMDEKILGVCIIIGSSYLTYFLTKIRLKSELAPVIPEYLNRPRWILIGAFYLSVGFSSLAYLVNLDHQGYTLMWVVLSTVVSDVSAYIFGSIIGGKKIAPKISPGKSWSGLFGAMICTAGLGYLFTLFLSNNNGLYMMILGAFLAIMAHVGDMLESAFKRYINIKDTSNILPGHGGILDRVDAVLMIATLVAILGIIMGESPLFFMA